MRRALLLLCAASSVEAETCDSSAYEANTAYNLGSVIKQEHVADADSCCALCSQEPQCQSWTFQVDKSLCKLKADPPGSRKTKKNHISGPGNEPPAPAPAPIPKNKPNFVLVLTDDQDALLNGYDPSVGIAHMHHLNKMVRSNGALFTRYYDAYALCSPSRSTILTGRYPHNHGFQTNSMLKSSNFHPVQERDTLNVWLNRTGYHTMLCGKYMNGYHGSEKMNSYETYIPDGWGHWYGFQQLDFFGPRVNMNGQSKVFPQDAYQTDIIANLSVNWLQNEWQRERPFFMFLTPHAPHDPHTPAPRHEGTLAGLTQPPNPAFNLEDDLQKLLPAGLDNLPKVNEGKMNKVYQARAECLLAIDDMIRDVVNQLKAMDELDKTYIIFSSDNGYHLGQHRLPAGKRLFFEHDINLPLIISGPGVAKGATIDAMVGNYDFAPTIAELAGAEPTSGAPVIDGLSWAGLLDGSAPSTPWPRNAALSEGYQDAEGLKGMCCGKYHSLRIHSDGQDVLYVETGSGDLAYFDNAVDPYQTTNIIGNLSADAKADLAARLSAVKSCAGQDCVLASSVQNLLV